MKVEETWLIEDAPASRLVELINEQLKAVVRDRDRFWLNELERIKRESDQSKGERDEIDELLAS